MDLCNGVRGMATSKVLARGQVTLPSEIRRKAGIKPGDLLNVEVVGKGQIRCLVLPDLGPRDLFERYPIDVLIDESRDRVKWEEVAARSVVAGANG